MNSKPATGRLRLQMSEQAHRAFVPGLMADAGLRSMQRSSLQIRGGGSKDHEVPVAEHPPSSQYGTFLRDQSQCLDS
jgi:hypothetical protein